MWFRAALLLMLSPVAACGTNPKALGITGPGAPAPVEPVQTPIDNQFDSNPDSLRFAPSMVPTTNGGRYWGYP